MTGATAFLAAAPVFAPAREAGEAGVWVLAAHGVDERPQSIKDARLALYRE